MGVAAKRIEAVHYPETDDMGEHLLQRFIAELLRPLIARWLQHERRNAFTGADTFFYFVEGDPTRYRAPDVYVIDGVAQSAPEVGSWKTWEGHRPSFALEIVGDDYKKDYLEAPADYAAMGVSEAIIFDPWATARSRKRVRWQVFRRVARKGFVRVETSMEDRVQSRSLGAWLRRVDVDGHVRLRVGFGPRGEELIPTDAEVAEAERTVRRVIEAQASAERLARQSAEEHARAVEAQARSAEEHARAVEAQARSAEEHARAVEAELAALRAELERLRRGG